MPPRSRAKPAEPEPADGSSTASTVPSEGQRSREDRIRDAAYAAYERRGSVPGDDVQDWLQAEAEIDGATGVRGERDA